MTYSPQHGSFLQGVPGGDSPEHYIRMLEEFDESALTQRAYSSASETLQDWIRGLWHRYCNFTHQDPHKTLKTFAINVLHNFFYWVLRQRNDTLRSASSLQTYWNVICLVRQKETGGLQVDTITKSQMKGVRQQLALQFNLSTEKKEKPIMRAEDLFELLRTLWVSEEVIFDHERHRAQMALILQLAGITGNRPGALLALRYEHVRVTLLRDPKGGEQPRIIIEITFKHTKGYLGEKDANTFGIPEVPREPCLLLCPQTVFLGLAFADSAFAAPDLDSPEQLFRLKIHPELNQQPLPWKESMLKVPLFRRSEPTVHGVQMSCDQAFPDSTLRPRLKTLGDVTGIEPPVGPYCFRRGNGEALDNSNYISESQRNLILQHSDSRVFQRNYLSRYITADTQAAYRGLDPQVALMRAASGMSRTIDRRRPRKLTTAQLAQIDERPDIVLLRRTRDNLKHYLGRKYGSIAAIRGTPLYAKYRGACRDYHNGRRRQEKVFLKEIRANYKKEQPVIDIQRQLNGHSADKEGTEDFRKLNYGLSERARAISSLFTFATSSLEEECGRRAEAINAVTALSGLQEGCRRRVQRQKRSSLSSESKNEDILSASIQPLDLSNCLPIECNPTQCIFCLGNEKLAKYDRVKSFHSHGDLKKHFKRKHLRHHPTGETIACPHPRCKEILQGTTHLQNHAETVHKTPT